MAQTSSALLLKQTHSAHKNAFMLNEKQLLNLQLHTLHLLEDIIALCNTYNLRYTLSGGTALGAVRHQGFIPWDDDADLNMPHADLVQLTRILQSRYSEDYDVLTPWNSHDYGLLFVQIRKKGTVARKQEDFCPQAEGICVDIFPLENMFNNSLLRTLHGYVSLTFGYIVSCKRIYDHWILFDEISKQNEALHDSFKKKATRGKLLSFISLDGWTRIANFIYSLCKNEHSIYLGIPAGRYHFFGELHKRKVYLPPTFGSFEGHTWALPGKYTVYFKALYGDYMKIPPAEEREHHWYRELSLPEPETEDSHQSVEK